MKDGEKKVLLQIQGGIPLVERPYQEIANALGWTEEEVMEQIRNLMEDGKIRRLGAVPNHYALGITANGMSVWDVPDEMVTEIGQRMGSLPEVTHCYRRPRHLPNWPYNLFAMIHGRSRQEVLETVDKMAQELGLQNFPHDVIFSTRLLKKTGTRFKDGNGAIG